MEVFLGYLLKSSGLVLLFWLFYQLLLHRVTFFTLNRWFLLLGLVLSLTLPFVYFTKTVWLESMPLDHSPTVHMPLPEAGSTTSFKGWLFLVVLYGIGTTFFAIRFLTQLYSLKKIIARGKSANRDGYRLIQLPEKLAPFSFFRCVICNPKHYAPKELSIILEHEKVHIRQWHSLDMLLVQLVQILQWFNPFLLLYKNALRQNLEFIADREVIEQKHPKKAYQYLLLKTGASVSNYTFINTFFNSSIKKRIVMLNTKTSQKIGKLKYVLMSPILIGFVLLFNVETVAKIRTEDPLVRDMRFLAEETESKLYIITKHTTEAELDRLGQQIKKEGNEVRFDNIVRDNKGKIISISIFYSSGNGNSVGTYTHDQGIMPIYFGKTENGGSFLATEVESAQPNDKKPLVLFDGEEITLLELNQMIPDQIHSMNVIKGEKAIQMYGQRAKDGVILVTSKKESAASSRGLLPPTPDTAEVQNHSPWKVSVGLMPKNPTPRSHYEQAAQFHKTKTGHEYPNLEDVLILVQGKQTSLADFEGIPAGQIESSHVNYNSETLKKYKANGKKAVFEVQLREPGTKIQQTRPDPLIIVDGKESPTAVLDTIDRHRIFSVNVLKGKNGIEKYGTKAKNGVIEITTKTEK